MGRQPLRPYFARPGQVNPKFKCLRCRRTMSELAFRRMVHWETGGGMRHVNAYHPVCWTCQEQVRGEHLDHPLYTPSIDRFFGKLLVSIRGGARTRGIAVLLEKDDLLGLYLEQEGRCALSGVKMVLDEGSHDVMNRVRPSVDRINSSGNYTTDNIQIICSVLNVMKGSMQQVDFLRWCEKVVQTQHSKEDQLLKAVS